jgi:hypothetical protein
VCWPKPDTLSSVAPAHFFREGRCCVPEDASGATIPLREWALAGLPLRAAPAEGTESKVCLVQKDEQSPSSTRLEHPVVTDACVRALGCPSLRFSRRPILIRPPREGRTHRGGPECFPSPGSIRIGEIALTVRSADLSQFASEEVSGRPTPL